MFISMRLIIAYILLCLPLTIVAQGTWEVPETSSSTTTTKANKPKGGTEEYEYARYLGDVVPVIDGEVEWRKTFHNNKNAEENYQMMVNHLTQMTQAETSLPESRVQVVNKTEHKIVCHFEEWMTFYSSILVLNRTRFIYTLACDCVDNEVTVRLMRLSYVDHDDNKKVDKHKAEEWITDQYALNKKRTKLMRITGKYRRLTVDRMEEVMEQLKGVIED